MFLRKETKNIQFNKLNFPHKQYLFNKIILCSVTLRTLLHHLTHKSTVEGKGTGVDQV